MQPQLPGKPPACCGCPPANAATWLDISSQSWQQKPWPGLPPLHCYHATHPVLALCRLQLHQEGLYIPIPSPHTRHIFQIPAGDRGEDTVTVFSLGPPGGRLHWVKCPPPPLSGCKPLSQAWSWPSVLTFIIHVLWVGWCLSWAILGSSIIIYSAQDSCNIQAWSNTFHASRVSSKTSSKPRGIRYRKDTKWSVFMAIVISARLSSLSS